MVNKADAMTKIIYIHVPKCGGSSFGAALRLRYLLSQSSIDLTQNHGQRRTQLRQLITRGTKMIAGHVQYDPHLHAQIARDYAFVTLLRDPVERFVSHYNYVQRHHPDPNRAPTLEAYVNTPDAHRLATQYLFYFAGNCPPGTDPVAQAISNLGRFSVVGRLDDPQTFARQLKTLIGTPLPRWRRNTAPNPTQVPADLRARIEQLCAPDIRIYQALHGYREAA